ncbi:hypothetical protein RR46_08714 [Papilio xuthus]|uniref:Uncharacterized protein n=1 Tax=Papilio xuthus TaxID=66420 RepID=A0A194Q808_PAPXU|nr:hypothetical protein RR46_08714 [Papilio xuthus]
MASVEKTAAAEKPTANRGSFKLRFAAHGERGRSNLSAIRPLGLPAPVTDKLGARAGPQAEEQAEASAMDLVQARFARGPRDLYQYPVTTAHEYGWWCESVRGGSQEGARGAAMGRHHIHDSGWLRARLRLLAPDAAYKRH